MIDKFSPCSLRRCALLLTIVALLACVGTVSGATDANIAKPETLGRSEERLLRSFHGIRSLRTFEEAMKVDDDSEERDLTDAVKKMAQAAKNKLTSNNQATTNKLFKKLQVGGTDDKLFQSTQFKEWVTTVTKNFKTNTELAQASLASALVSHYGDEALATLLVAAKQNYKSRPVATQLENAQLRNWESAGKTGDDVFDLLKLNDKGEKLFESPMVGTWISYMTKLNTQNSDEVIFSSLKKLFDDEALAKMIAGAKDSASTAATAKKLEQVQLKNWLSDGKTADDVFKLLQLNKDGDTIFASSFWSVWSSYLAKLDKENADDLMFVVLKKHYGDEGVAKMVSVANKEASTKDIGRKLEEELWRSQGKDGDDVFKLLKLDEEGQKFFESPALSTWVSYVTKLNKQNPGAISQLEKRFGGDIELARMIGFAKQQATNAATEKVITQLQNLQFKQWVGDGRTLNTMSDKMLLPKSDTMDIKVFLDYYDFHKTI
ncbi:hypothetical protein PRIC2_011398 [Phytophthora ramorum]